MCVFVSVCGCAVVCIYVIYIYVCFCVFTVHESGVSVNKTITVLPVWPCCTVPFTITCCSFALFCIHLPEIHRFTTSSHESDPPRFHHFIHLVSKEWTKIRQWGATAVAKQIKEGSTHTQSFETLDEGAIDADGEACDFFFFVLHIVWGYW